MEITTSKRLFKFRLGTNAQSTPDLSTKRVTSIDLLRGAVMAIMAIDHVRDYFHDAAFLYDPTDLTKTSIPLFLTRFVTHFCAPAFMLLAGTSAYLVGTRKGKKALSRFLLTRGLWLVFLELTVINFGWFFDISYSNTGTLVIWALGVSMILLSALIYLPKMIILSLSLLMIFGHNLIDTVQVQGQSTGSIIWALLHAPRVFQFEGVTWFALYPLIPWIGVMSIGYCLGTLYNENMPIQKRKNLLLQMGVAAIVLFIVIRFMNSYGDPFSWSSQPRASYTVLSFINLNKYPPSLLYLLVTLGPCLVFLAITEKSNGWLSRQLQVIGRVPMFYYLVHIYLIHLAAMLAAELTPGINWDAMVLSTWVNFDPKLQGYGIGLTATYAVWFGLMIVLYGMCRWYDQYKRSHKHWWLSYL